uniref:Uncharacterized protein n=1 Tax=Molossus molossus TaxID=27622 RepID=A0A7J8HHR6_MOLMO|nr:hypothetical protein HJG59_011040 [Molossus molossus]
MISPRGRYARSHYTHHKLTLGAIESDTFDCGIISVALISLNILGPITVRGAEEINVFIIVTAQELSAIVAIHKADDVCFGLTVHQVMRTEFLEYSIVLILINFPLVINPYKLILSTTANW